MLFRSKDKKKNIKIKQDKVDTKLITLQDENSLDEHLTDDDIKRSKQDIETEICSYSPIAFLHKYQHKVQSPHIEELSTKGI